MEFQINKDYHRQRIDIYAYRVGPMGNEFISPFEGGFQHYTIQFDQLPGEEIKPLVSLPFSLGLAFIERVAEYAKNEGISVKEQSNNAGKLQVIEQHNQFLQTNLVKLIDFAISGPGDKIKSV